MEKERRTKALVLSTLVVVVATLSIAFAAMSQVLNINGIGKMDTASWSVYFDNLSDAKITRGAEEVGKPKISDDKGIVQDINVKLSNPKDEISYTVDIVNDGTIDAEITMIKDIELTEVQKKVFEFKVTYTDTGEVLKDGDLLPAGDTKNITIIIRFKDDITEFDLPTESQTINLSYQLTYTQYDGDGAIVGPNGSEDENLPRYVLSKSWKSNMSIGFSSDVEEVSFLRSSAVPEQAIDTVFDASEAGDNSVIGWYMDDDSNGLYEVYLGANGIVAAPEDSSILFMNMKMLKNINFDNNFDTSNVTKLGRIQTRKVYGIFYGCSSLITLDLSNFNTPNVIDMRYMFYNCTSLTNADLSSFDTSNVTSLSYMFYNCSLLTSIDLSNFNTSNVTSIGSMFYNCSLLTSIDLSNFNTSNVTSIGSIFYGCSSLINVNLSNFDFSNVTTTTNIFTNCTPTISLDLSNANLTTVSDITSFFNGLIDLSFLTSINITNIKLSGTVSMSGMFKGATSIPKIYFSVDKSSDVEIDAGYMFESCESPVLDLSNFDTSKIVNMNVMFSHCTSLTSIDLSNWNTENVTNMQGMFFYCTSLTSLNLGSFDTSNVTTMSYMFDGCSSLTSIDLSNFNTSKVTSMSDMFYHCSSLVNLNLSGWDTTNVTNMNVGGSPTSGLFNECSSLVSLDLSDWDTSKITDMSYMFYECSSLTSLDLSNWDASNVTNMSHMFYNCTSLYTLNLTGFKTRNVTSMGSMFSGCSKLVELDMSLFETSNLTYTYGMFRNCSSLEILKLNSADFSKNDGRYSYMFSNCDITTIYVKDEENKTLLMGFGAGADNYIIAPLTS